MVKKLRNGIQGSAIDFAESRLTLQEALASPCQMCSTSPCCTYLPLFTFQITNLIELDHVLIYMSNFDRIELGLSPAGEWSIYYCHPCRFLNRHDFTCDIHGQPERPRICISFNPYSCWYRRVFTRSASNDFIRVDRQRLEFIISHIVFDEARNIVEVPDWETMIDGVASLPLEPHPNGSEPPSEGPVSGLWEELTAGGHSLNSGGEVYSYEALDDVCSYCQAYCCKALVFPQGKPLTISNIDHFRFCLGFPGIELGIADDTWSIIVKTTCQHLQENRCSIYGMPQRPLLCQYYDAWKCVYKFQFGLPQSPGFLRIGLRQFEHLAACFKFDQNGVVVKSPSVDELRDHIEAGRCEAPQES